MQVIKCNSNVMAITCHIFECNALHYNYVMRKNCPLQITFHYFENVIHYNYITITITITPGLGGRVDTEVRRLVPSSHKRSKRRHKIILHPDSLREKAIRIAFVSAEGI